jgi:hypothetical protein
MKVDIDGEREVTFAGLMLLEAVDDAEAWSLFWDAVSLARRRHHETWLHQGARRMTGSAAKGRAGASRSETPVTDVPALSLLRPTASAAELGTPGDPDSP